MGLRESSKYCLPLDFYSANSHFIQSRLKKSMLRPYRLYRLHHLGGKELPSPNTNSSRPEMLTKQRYSKRKNTGNRLTKSGQLYGWQLYAIALLYWRLWSA